MDKCVTGHARKKQRNTKSKQTKGYTAHGSRFEYGSPDRLWEKLIHSRAEDNQTVSPLQWGSWPNLSSTDAILMKRLTYNGIRICKKGGSDIQKRWICCLDRMIPSIGAIVLRRLGQVEINAVCALLKPLEKRKYKVRTTLGIRNNHILISRTGC